jgi:hypothetical protein
MLHTDLSLHAALTKRKRNFPKSDAVWKIGELWAEKYFHFFALQGAQLLYKLKKAIPLMHYVQSGYRITRYMISSITSSKFSTYD